MQPVISRRPFHAFRSLKKRTSRGSILDNGGSALVVVLGILVLLLILIVSFLASVTRMSTSSQHYASGASARSLSLSAVEMITSQIRLATAGAPTNTWTSQPGMLRTFGTNAVAQNVYKLYSAPAMTVGAGTYQETDDTPSSGWKSSPWRYVDMNQPAYDSTNYLVYPIVDPRAATSSTSGRQPVTGFALGTAPAPDYNSGLPDSPANNSAPMPVTWLYFRADGTITVPQSANANGDVTFSPAPTAANPVIGRVGVWTDDDTCKVNVNTASYSTNTFNATTPPTSASYLSYWDTPYRISQEEETYLSEDQPWKGEYQRYPGHPATTGLNGILPELTSQQLFTLSPRFQYGGSVGGTVTSLGATSTAVAALSIKSDRLYASVDELFYNTTRNASSTSNLSTLNIHDLDAKRFFLTAQSRAPELNLFGQPRVTIWPIPDIVTNRSPLDKLIAFDSTIGQEKFYFTRNNPLSQTVDIGLSDSYGSNALLYAYLQRMTGRPTPGFVSTANGFLDKYPAGTSGITDRDQILTSIFDTIRTTNLSEISSGVAWPYTYNPPTSGSPTVNQTIMGQVLPTVHPNGSRGAGRIYCIDEASLVFVNTDSTACATNNAVQPANAVSLPVARAADSSNVLMGILFKFNLPTAGAVGAGMNFGYVVKGLTTGAGGTPLSVTFTPQTGGAQVTQNLFSSFDTFQHGSWEYNFSATLGGDVMLPNCISDTYKLLPNNTSGISGSASTYDIPCTSDLFKMQGASFQFNGGQFTVEIHYPYNDSPTNPYIQKYTFNFPPTTLPTPYYCRNFTSIAGYAQPGPWNNFPTNSQPVQVLDTNSPPLNPGGRFTNNASYSGYQAQWVSNRDTVRSLQMVNGDVRILAHMKDVPASMFAPTPNYTNVTSGTTAFTVPQHSLNQIGAPLLGGSSGSLIPGLTSTSYNTMGFNASIVPGSGTCLPAAPISVTGATNSLGYEGDWNNGYAWVPDGAYLPKSDEGVGYTEGVNTSLYGYFVRSNLVQKLLYQGDSPTLFSANRQVQSAVLFGSIPTGVQRNLPWQTLLFRPDRSYHMGNGSHPGAAVPPDYLLLDLFQMPVVEPYAISEPFSTAGKANMNYRIKPFSSYITRDAAVRSVLSSTLISAIPQAAVSGFREDTGQTPGYAGLTKWPIDTSQTLSFFETRFNSTTPVFISESEICNIDLVPVGWSATASSLGSFWNGATASLTASDSKRYTGDNLLERPYALIYPRLTTRSNTYTVHVYAEALSPAQASAGGWNESTGHISGVWRGEYCLERYLDPNDTTLPSVTSPSSGFLYQDYNLNANYKFHTLYSRRFSP